MKIYGKNAIAEAFRAGKTVNSLLVEKGINHELIALARKANAKVQFVDRKTLDKLAPDAKHQGFIAEISDFEYSSVEEILDMRKDYHFILILDGIEDPHNLGSILRVCECAGVDGVIIPKNRAVSVNDTVVKVSAGASEHVKVARVANINQTIEELKRKNIFVYGADMGGEPLYDTDLTGNIAIVVGGEGQGIKYHTKELCDKLISIPLKGKVNSLNASVAAGVVVYEAVRQRL